MGFCFVFEFLRQGFMWLWPQLLPSGLHLHGTCWVTGSASPLQQSATIITSKCLDNPTHHARLDIVTLEARSVISNTIPHGFKCLLPPLLPFLSFLKVLKLGHNHDVKDFTMTFSSKHTMSMATAPSVPVSLSPSFPQMAPFLLSCTRVLAVS